MHTLFSSSPNFAGILPQQAYPQKYPSPAFSHIFFAPLFLRKSKRQTKVAVKKNTSQDENIHFNFIRIKSKEATAEQKNRKNIKIKEFAETKKDVFVNQPWLSPPIEKNKRKIKKSKG